MISGVRASSTRIEVDLVDDRVVVAALHHRLAVVFHVVAQIVEAELVVGGVGDVGGVGGAALVVGQAVDDDADGQAEELVDAAHPFRVAPGEIVVDGDDMDALAGERVEIDGQRRHQRLALAGAHLGDAAIVKDHAADELDVEGPHAEARAARLRAPWRRPGREDRRAMRRWRDRRGTVRCAPRARSSDRARSSFSMALIASTRGRVALMRRSLEEPKILRARTPRLTINGPFNRSFAGGPRWNPRDPAG